MATNPGDLPADIPQPTQPAQPDVPPPEVSPPGPDIDMPSPGAPNETPAPANPTIEADMTERKTVDVRPNRDDDRPDIEQAVEARSDAVERGDGGSKPAMFTDTGEFDGNSGTGGEVKNQDDTQQ